MNAPPIATVRAWVTLIFGCLAIGFGLIKGDATVLMLGFAVLGGEPVYRAANGGP